MTARPGTSVPLSPAERTLTCIGAGSCRGKGRLYGVAILRTAGGWTVTPGQGTDVPERARQAEIITRGATGPHRTLRDARHALNCAWEALAARREA